MTSTITYTAVMKRYCEAKCCGIFIWWFYFEGTTRFTALFFTNHHIDKLMFIDPNLEKCFCFP